ncbi:MAG: peptide deformylase [Patescibacteria group bacterium]|nr:peptide deformylase [Patescibacteria group bacterium]
MNNNLKIFKIDNPKEKSFLNQKTQDFDFSKFNNKQITELINLMKKIMKKANGIGLSANQIGFNFRMFIAEIPEKDGKKFYAIFNPKIEKLEGEKIDLEEGCLSIPNIYGTVPRYPKITVSGFNRYGKPIKIKAWGLLAHVFQHEIDHLDGKLFIEKAKKTYKPEELKNLNQNE